ncbi:14952_t:CDS:2, partial [Dentiscutata heterogama]
MENTFDEFEYEDKVLDEAKGYYIEEAPEDELYKNLWEDYQNPAACLVNIEELPTYEPDPEEEPLEEKLERSL